MADLELNVNVDVKNQDKLRTLGGGLKTAGTELLKWGAVGVAGLGAIGVAATKMAGDAEAAQSKVVGTFKSMGAASFTTVKQLNAQADALDKATAFDDEQVKEVQATLLTFGNVTGDAFKEATDAALDMSQFFGQDLQSSSVQLGKALNDPIKGIGALARIGVSFTKKQQDTIKALVDSGDAAKAQGIILAAVQEQVGTAAEDFAKTGPGMLAEVGDQFGNVMEAIGAAILPLLKEMLPGLIEGLRGFAAFVTANMPTIKAIISTVFGAIGSAISFLVDNVFPLLGQAFTWLSTNIFPLFNQAASQSGGIFQTIGGIISFFATNVLPVLLNVFKQVVAWVAANWPTISSIFSQVFGAIAAAVKVIWPIVARIAEVLFPLVLNAATILLNGLDGIFKLVGGIFEVVGTTVQGVVDGIVAAWEFLSDVTETIWNGITGIVKGVLNGLIDVVNGFFGFLNGLSFGAGPWDVGPIHVDAIAIDPFNIPLIPHLASGGIVSGPTLALLGERGPEAVVPLDRGAIGATVNRILNLDIQAPLRAGDAEQIAEYIGRVDRLDRAMEWTGA